MKKYYEKLKESCRGDHAKKEVSEERLNFHMWDRCESEEEEMLFFEKLRSGKVVDCGDYELTLEEECYVVFKKNYENTSISFDEIDHIEQVAAVYGFTKIGFLKFKRELSEPWLANENCCIEFDVEQALDDEYFCKEIMVSEIEFIGGAENEK